ncbi:MAG: AAA family ATPase [Candidatus Borkfalkiaceae bacterium]|nr:AAA family ATPase [Christensenellaceae bacterium]
MNNYNLFELSEEQKQFIQQAKEGKNILVDACIGSGKTTAIQFLCNELSADLKILYLTYNKLLKIDAQSKIRNKNIYVTNYHGFAFSALKKSKISAGISDLIQVFNKEKPLLYPYDVLIIDEYQDIEQELAEMLEYIKSANPNMQIIAVGDMAQKIYDKTTLCVPAFIKNFLGEHINLEFTQCFRLSSNIADALGRIWNKKIIGINSNCIVEKMNISSVVEFLSKQNTSDILCLGSRTGALSETLNILETRYPEKFNKESTYASISDEDRNITPTSTTAIFTTFDSSKGLERKICVVFDFTEIYWETRINQPQQSYEILRNIFCVAASRGKEHIIFVEKETILSEQTLSTKIDINKNFRNVFISNMFDFKYKEDIEKCFSFLQTKKIDLQNTSEIVIKNHDCLIDLAPCIGIYQEAMFFNEYDIDKEIEHFFFIKPDQKHLYTKKVKRSSLDKKILFLTSLNTNQERYRKQVITPFVAKSEQEQIENRLLSILKKDEQVQVPCTIDFSDKTGGNNLFSASGLADVVKNDIVYELKFTSELKHEHFLQCACYMIALNLNAGRLWNTRKNELFEIKISDRKNFMDSVTNAITKNKIKNYFLPKEIKK